MKYSVFYEGHRCICPECGGLVLGDEEQKVCIDCKRRYVVIEEGDSDREMIFERREE